MRNIVVQASSLQRKAQGQLALSGQAGSLHHKGFTLIEVLTAMMVLAIGLSGTISLIYGSTRAANTATDRNVATSLMQEAIADIQRNHLIGTTMPGVTVPAADVGLYVETWDSGGSLPSPDGNPSWPNLKNGVFANAGANAFKNFRPSAATIAPWNNPTTQWSKELFWPYTAAPRYYGGPLAGTAPTGTAYRVLYKLERHPNWIAVPPQLAYEGVYVVTMTVYKDLNPIVHVNDAFTPKHLEQVSDPTVVYLRARGVN